MQNESDKAREALSGMGERQDPLEMLKFRDIDRSTLGYGGRFYPMSWRFQVKSVMIDEVKHFTAVNETNFLEVLDATSYIIDKCVRIKDGNTIIPSSNLLAWDRMPMLLHVRNVSNIGAALSFTFKAPCGHEVKSSIEPGTLKFIDIPEKYVKYVAGQGFNIETKSYGMIQYLPATIAFDNSLKDFMRSMAGKSQDVDKLFVKLTKFFTQKSAELAYDEYLDLRESGKLSLLTKIVDELDLGHKNEVTYTCKICKSEGFRTAEFVDGIRNIFSVPIKVDDELI